MLPAQVSYWTLQENKRHNLETEGIQKEQNRISQFTAEEQQRHNIQTENVGWFQSYETKRHNIATEDVAQFSAQETARHNVQQEHIGYINASANVKQADAAMLRAKTDKARYKLEKQYQPYKILLAGAQASKANAEADYTRGIKTTATKAQVYKTLVDIAQVPLENRLSVWDKINGTMSNITGLVRAGASTQSSRSRQQTNVGRAIDKAKSKGGKSNGKKK